MPVVSTPSTFAPERVTHRVTLAGTLPTCVRVCVESLYALDP